ncbi:MAG: hypothetical protein A2509_05770 [Candidatus Edwardsbacteria bacterium RIFOXYD12_FULL_50_11]|uniref:Uncharacterized protein n=1 Tax=Candidatus Edwardsbacteria bacterium GWF2_54_11 TaxID=1817851 RepID=A0A1F5R675_9BACT|nr:MAG: hypothetical protein A2502_10845 [Candidatus Edwardsbacteria bacterium RifOxyC12_full_54_24]OGF06675.1 MAG: hypothetical protein A2273_00220 [Candidatus Edwardsbacteria bacterium RifOxyA12_full_54_48]OGF09411.1 MAG: hypothetical protein A2024_00520 [Candidatus Edwardsbacteria bacterium GWF2_54_11]OGF10626.1 MAG: hypothetical protein A3K15_05585 [Candidatus Edwardsbacteria bacterium GWE2_54_12]OGF15407.1 MAG: hypothetical protein A2509_05770 [Candidatus Edwardsbacteria bacterium RIFOXYD1
MQTIISSIRYFNSGYNQRLVFLFILSCIFSLLFGCTKKEANVQNTKVIVNDTLYVKGKSVIFFSLTNTEYDSIVKNGGKTNEIDEVLSDFQHYTNIVIDSLNKTGVKCSISSKPIYKIVKDNGEVTMFSKTGKEHIVGAILTDGKKNPKFYFGVATDADYFDMIANYFYKKQVK